MTGDEDDDEDDPSIEQEAPLHDAGDPKAVKKRLSKAQLAKRESERFWRDVFATEVGRREMWALLRDTGALTVEFSCGPNGFPQPEATWFKTGQREFGLRLYRSWLRLDRDGVFAMHEDNDPDFADRSHKG